MNLFLDTAALVKLYHDEDGTENLSNFINEYSSDLILTISDLIILEFHSAILRRVRMKQIGVDLARQLFEELNKDTAWMNITEVDKSVKTEAANLLSTHAPTKNFRTLDSLQLATAIVAHERLPINYFITADERLLEIAQNYFSIYNPLKQSKN